MAGETDLPLPDYDQLPVGTIAHAIRALSENDLVRLLEYESDHADRVQVKQILAARLEEVAAGDTPSPGGPVPGPRQGTDGEQPLPVRPDTAAEPINPPPHGVPTNAPSRRHDQG